MRLKGIKMYNVNLGIKLIPSLLRLSCRVQNVRRNCFQRDLTLRPRRHIYVMRRRIRDIVQGIEPRITTRLQWTGSFLKNKTLEFKLIIVQLKT